MPLHSVLAASAAYRWMNCPGSIRLSGGIDQAPSAYAEEGTAAHVLAEQCLSRGDNGRDYVDWYVGTNAKGVGFLQEKDPRERDPELASVFVVTEEMADAVQVYLDAIRADMKANPTASLAIEKKFDLSSWFPGMFGTNDASLSEPFGRLVVYDYKHGAGYPVEVERNSQLLYYAFGAYLGEDYETIEMVIIQPRARHKDGPVRRYALSARELNTWAKEELRPAAMATEPANAPVVPGSWCKFCPVLHTCRAFADHAMSVVKSDFRQIDLPSPELLTDSELAVIMSSADVLKTWLTGIFAAAQEKLLAGGNIPGWKLVQKKTNRRWIDEQKVVDFFANNHRKQVRIYEQKLRSPAQLEKAIKELKLSIDIEDLWEKPDGGLTLASESDRRPAVTANPALDFVDVDKEVSFL